MQLTAYHRLFENARAMLKAGREARWDDLTQLEAEREGYLSEVRQAVVISTKPSDIKACMELIQSILECDEQTKTLLRSRQDELSEVLGSMDNARKLKNAYRSA
ncbi:flagellar protein FliT [mine drainage metagenome]|uniref:Flagellar protein FliT n=1 Tax=mine drainage metagenome TaxID=410659 RepID=A0A1J5QPV6_9ZZZZ